uniref:Uncharacterized protein n=1 Tax=Cajanus cajan TaxID=3821 RepID=A0A151S3U2_CAJCA|nr:hypothetical protein KK1_028819 [Cajanus cajan]
MCTCSIRCSCNVLPVMEQRKCEDQAMQFLRGLNDQYSNIRSHILLMDPIPPISKIFSYVVARTPIDSTSTKEVFHVGCFELFTSEKLPTLKRET